MPTRTIVLTALLASCVSSVVTLAVALLVLAPSIRAAPDAQAVQKVVTTRRLDIVDARGHLRATLGTTGAAGVDTESVGFVLLNERGDTRAQLTAGQADSFFRLLSGPTTLPDGPTAYAKLAPGNLEFGDLPSLQRGFTDRVSIGAGNPVTAVPRQPYRVYVKDEHGQVLWQAP